MAHGSGNVREIKREREKEREFESFGQFFSTTSFLRISRIVNVIFFSFFLFFFFLVLDLDLKRERVDFSR